MRFSKKSTTIVAGVGAAALGVCLVALGSGVGAKFTDSATGSATIDVGQFGCELVSPPGSGVTVASDGHSATVTLSTIESSTPSNETAPLTVKNTGSMPVVTNWTASIVSGTLTNRFSPVPVAGSVLYNTNDTQTADIGFQWTELANADLGRSGTVKYTVQCNETGFSLFDHDGGTAAWDNTSQAVTLDIPDSTGPDGAGINVTAPGSTLPSTAPSFVTDTYGAGTPRWAIGFSNGKHAFGYPSQANPSNWTLPGSGAATDWQAVKDYVANNKLTVTSAFIVADTSNGKQTSNITCADYSGTPLFGTGC